jgi:hypothetical protein
VSPLNGLPAPATGRSIAERPVRQGVAVTGRARVSPKVMVLRSVSPPPAPPLAACARFHKSAYAKGTARVMRNRARGGEIGLPMRIFEKFINKFVIKNVLCDIHLRTGSVHCATTDGLSFSSTANAHRWALRAIVRARP